MEDDPHAMKLGIYCFVMPFASPASTKHAGRLIECLVPNAKLLFAVCSRNLNLSNYPGEVLSHTKLTPLHYYIDIKPRVWSAMLWIMKLIWVMLNASIVFMKNHRKIELVVCFLGSYYTPILIIAKALNKKVILYDPTGEAAALEKTYKPWRSWKFLSGLLDAQTKVNRGLADLIIIESLQVISQGRLEPYRQKLRLVKNSLDIDLYQSTVNYECRMPVVGFLGRLSLDKGILPLLDAAELMCGTGISFKIAGDGPLRMDIERRLKSPKMSHVNYLGWIEGKAIVEFLNEIQLLIHPSAGEGVPNSILEAMACGTPVLATPVGGVCDLIAHHQTGFLLPDTRPATMVAAIMAALQAPGLMSIVRRGQELVRDHYSLAASSRQWQSVLSELMA